MDKCTIVCKHSKIKVEENGKKVIFSNLSNDEFKITQIDNCLIKEGVRADRLVTKTGVASVIVELKGKDIAHAIKQVFATMNYKEIKDKCENNIGFLIVCSRVPRIGYDIIKAKTFASREYKAGFHVKERAVDVDITEVAKIDGKP